MQVVSEVDTTRGEIPAEGRRALRRVLWWTVLGSPVLFGGSLCLGRVLLEKFSASVVVSWSLVAMLGLMVGLATVGFLFHVMRYWRSPVRQLGRTLELIRAGKAPMDELEKIGGGVDAVVGVLKEILRDLRQQKAELATLSREMGQRIANRTDALERTMGSLRQQAVRDELTGLYNRRMLNEYLPRCIEECRGEQSGVCLLMIDVDHFKNLNDTQGHGAGDELLKILGQLIRSTIREHDVGFRYGGDEFVIVLPRCGEREGNGLAARLGSLTDAIAPTLHVTPAPRLSIGLATLEDVGQGGGAALLRVADERLYAMKNQRHAQRPVKKSA